MSPLGEHFTLKELAQYVGETEERLLQWQGLGVIGTDPAGFTRDDVERVRLAQVCIRRGLTAEDLMTVSGMWSLKEYRNRNARLRARPAGSLPEVASLIGLDHQVAKRLWTAAGLVDQGESADRADVAMLEGSKMVIDAGFPEEGVLEMYRVLDATLGRAAEALQQTTHVYQLEVPIALGTSAAEAASRAQAMGDRLPRMVEPMVLYFLRKALARSAREDYAVHIAIENGKAAFSEVPGRIRRGIAFIDLSDFTPLTVTRSDLEGAAVLGRFRDIVHEQVTNASGSVVKQIGDEFMLAFHNARDAIECVAAVHRAVESEPQFPAVRSGIHCGEMLYRDGDYVGTVPNAAARIRGVAGRHQIMVSGEARREAGSIEGTEFVRVGRRALKGLPEDMEVFEVVPGGSVGDARTVDPVCGIEMTAGSVAAQLTLDGMEREFCSDDCLRKFVSEPGRYERVQSEE